MLSLQMATIMPLAAAHASFAKAAEALTQIAATFPFPPPSSEKPEPSAVSRAIDALHIARESDEQALKYLVAAVQMWPAVTRVPE